jgi:hypothetical protein
MRPSFLRSLENLGRRRQRPHPAEDQPHLVSARRAVAVVVVTVLLCALLDADGLAGSVSQQQFGTARSVELALVRPLQRISHWAGLDLPRRWLSSLHGGSPGLPNPSSPPPTVAVPPPSRPGPSPTAVVPTSVAGPPVLSAARPLRVWLAGDSMMGEIAQAFEESQAGNPLMSVSDTVEIGTGLARPDVFDWPAEVARQMSVAHPDVVVLVFGANDDQDMMVNGSRVVLGTPQWEAEYSRRVAQVAAAVAGPGRLLVWLEVPPTARPQINRTDGVIDRILTRVAAAQPDMSVVNLTPAVAPAGVFTEYLPGSSGQPVAVRDPDGVHLTPDGAQRVVPLILAAIRRQWPTA